MSGLYERCRQIIDEQCGTDEDIIRLVGRKFAEDGKLDPEFAVQQWLAVLERRKLRRAIDKQEKLDIGQTRRNHADKL